MANLYWYGGTGNWSDYTNHWSNNSGNSPASPASAAPTSSDNVFIDSSSGFGSGGTITLDEDGLCHDITSSSGHTYSIIKTDNENLKVYGSAVFESGLTLSPQNLYFEGSGNENKTITRNNATIDTYIQLDDSKDPGSIWTLQDDLVLSQSFDFEAGTFDANDKNLTSYLFYLAGYNSGTIYMGSGTWNTNDFEIDDQDNLMTFYPESSTIKLTDSEPWFFVSGKTVYNVWVTEGPAHFDSWGYTDGGSFSCNNLRIDPGVTVYFNPGSTTTVNTFNGDGGVGNLIVLDTSPKRGAIATVEVYAGSNNSRDYIVNDKLTLTGEGNNAVVNVETVSTEILGDELILNGTFTGNADNWSLNGDCVYNNNAIDFTDNNTNGWIQQTVSGIEVGKFYKLTFDVSNSNNGKINWVRPPRSYGVYLGQILTDGTKTIYFSAESLYVNNYLQIANETYSETNHFIGTIDNVSIMEVTQIGGKVLTVSVFEGGTGYKVSSYYTTGGSGTQSPLINVLTINPNSEQFVISKPSGTVVCDYLDISNSNANGGAKWYAGFHSNNTTNNDGWIFTGLNTVTSPYPSFHR